MRDDASVQYNQMWPAGNFRSPKRCAAYSRIEGFLRHGASEARELAHPTSCAVLPVSTKNLNGPLLVPQDDYYWYSNARLDS